VTNTNVSLEIHFIALSDPHEQATRVPHTMHERHAAVINKTTRAEVDANTPSRSSWHAEIDANTLSRTLWLAEIDTNGPSRLLLQVETIFHAPPNVPRR
jgi:hypothetical protein